MSTHPHPFPPLPDPAWVPTRETLHRFAQVVGKVRLAGSHRRNHWWNVPFHLTGRGLTTRPTSADPTFAIDFDFLDHRLEINTDAGPRLTFPLVGQSVASFTDELLSGLRHVGVDVVPAIARPFDLPDADRPFAKDTEHADYDPAAVTAWWRVLGRVNLLLEEFAAGWSGKTSPVHVFWHTFDIAVTRFSDRVVEQPPLTDPVTREAYSREVISSGFWFGDDAFEDPAFYSYVAPEPDGLADEPLRPDAAFRAERRGTPLAVLRYSDAARSDDPRAAALEFFTSTFESGARKAGWNLEEQVCAGGATDPHVEMPRPTADAPANG